MNYKIAFLFLALSSLLSKTSAVGISETTNGVYLVVAGVRNVTPITNEPIRFDDRLLWMTFCDKGKIELSWPDVAYSVKIKMTDTNGIDVPKTTLGNQFGSKYDRLHKITDSQVSPELAWGSFKDNPVLGGGRFLPKPSELFQIEKSGNYILEIQMQMFRYVPSRDVEERSKTLFQFTPVKIRVEKPVEKK